jgi:hypothetical protein
MTGNIKRLTPIWVRQPELSYGIQTPRQGWRRERIWDLTFSTQDVGCCE